MTQASPSPAVDGAAGAAPLEPASGADAHLRQRPLPRRGLERLDLLLLCLEALDLNGGEAMVWLSEQLGYQNLFPNRVELWKQRCHNPLRRACRRGELASEHSDALIRILCLMADRLYPMLRALLSSQEPAALTRERWQLFEERLGALLRERMNPRRSGVQQLLDPVAGAEQRRLLVRSLALATGTGGFDRLRASLLDAAA
jgi:hypothetical protein